MYHLGSGSKAELVGVHPNVVDVTERAIETTPQDFTVFDGLRLLAEQEEYVRTGVSKTLKSKHLKQPDGYGHAVDLVPYINGKARWEIRPCIVIAGAVHDACEELDVDMLWGAVWDRTLRELDRDNLDKEIERYKARRKKKGKTAFIDAPHYQLII